MRDALSTNYALCKSSRVGVIGSYLAKGNEHSLGSSSSMVV